MHFVRAGDATVRHAGDRVDQLVLNVHTCSAVRQSSTDRIKTYGRIGDKVTGLSEFISNKTKTIRHLILNQEPKQTNQKPEKGKRTSGGKARVGSESNNLLAARRRCQAIVKRLQYYANRRRRLGECEDNKDTTKDQNDDQDGGYTTVCLLAEEKARG
eukprot:COSAG06_NODE_8200_length_2217_cov_23.858477_1_plen_158_part_00